MLLLTRALQLNGSVEASFYWPDALPDAKPSTSSVQGTIITNSALLICERARNAQVAVHPARDAQVTRRRHRFALKQYY